MKADRLSLGEAIVPTCDLERRAIIFLNRWQWRCPTKVAFDELMELIRTADEESPATLLIDGD